MVRFMRASCLLLLDGCGPDDLFLEINLGSLFIPVVLTGLVCICVSRRVVGDAQDCMPVRGWMGRCLSCLCCMPAVRRRAVLFGLSPVDGAGPVFFSGYR